MGPSDLEVFCHENLVLQLRKTRRDISRKDDICDRWLPHTNTRATRELIDYDVMSEFPDPGS